MAKQAARKGPRPKPQVTTDKDPKPVEGKLCEINDCKAAGTYKAPVSPDNLDSHYWFCLDHVREYNKAWNFCAGKDEDEIERMIREDIVGWRPTWPLGRLGKNFSKAQFDQFEQMRDQFGLFEKEKRNKRRKAANGANGTKNGHSRNGAAHTRINEALDIFELSTPVTADVVKERYKKLVKQHHPDANGGDKAAEERLKLINQAYTTLKEQYGS